MKKFLLQFVVLGCVLVVLVGCAPRKVQAASQSNAAKSVASQDAAADNLDPAAVSGKAKVYMTRDISPAGMAKVYAAMGRTPKGKVAVKLSTGEPGGHHFLAPALIKNLVQSVNGTIVECNTAYGGKRASTAMHKQVAIDHGFAAIAKVDIMDENGSMSLPFPKGKNLKENFVGANFKNYDFYLVLSHFKGHQMGGFGGALKNISIGIASGEGKRWIHTGGKSKTGFSGDQTAFLESMAEAAGSVMLKLGDNMMYINVMNNLSIDCDCNSNPTPPEMDDIGILSSLDPVALDKACVDLIYAADTKRRETLRNRIESRNGTHILTHAEALGLGTQQYELIILD